MKKLILFCAIAICTLNSNLYAQGFELTPTYGYQFGTKISYGNNYIKFKDGGQFGITAGFELQEGFMVELSYNNMSSEVVIRDILLAPTETRLSDLNLDWFLIGATRYFQSGPLKPFAGGGLGFVVVSPKNVNQDLVIGNISSETRFAFSFKAGINYMITDVIGLNLQGNVFFPVNYGGYYIGTGGAGVSAGSTLILGGFSGGLVFRFDK